MRTAATFICIVWAVIISFTALFLPPKGIIDSSVIILVAQILVFAATMFGIALPTSFNEFFNHHANRNNTTVAKG